MRLRSLLLFIVAAISEIGGAWLIWQGIRERPRLLFVASAVVALAACGFVATLQPSAQFGRVLAAYGGIFVAAPWRGESSSTAFAQTATTSSALKGSR